MKNPHFYPFLPNYFFVLLFWALSSSTPSYAQPGPSIGINQLPSASDPICNEPVFTGSFFTSGYPVGATVGDFKLYGLSGDSLVLSQVLSSGKPVLLISGSLTCPVFRNKLPIINQVVSAYSGLLDVYIIYTLEAHPTDTSVYFGYVNVTTQNQTDGVLFPSPLNYGGRKALADTLVQQYSITAPVFLDGPCNPWWNQFGPAPNNAYVIRPNGTVAIHHGWFDRSPRNIFCELDTFLGVTSGLCNTSSSGGNFVVNFLNQSANGNPGNVLYIYADIINNTTLDCEVDIKKQQTQLPTGWETSFCTDICHSIHDDSIRIFLPAGDTMKMSLDYFTSATPDSGRVRIGFRNVQNANNNFSFWTEGITTSSVNLNPEISERKNLRIFPNPFIEQVEISGIYSAPYTISSTDGRVIESGVVNEDMKIYPEVPAGIYILEIQAVRIRLIRLKN